MPPQPNKSLMSLLVSDLTGVFPVFDCIGWIGCMPGRCMAFILTGDLDFIGRRSSNADKSAGFRLLLAELLFEAAPRGPSIMELELLRPGVPVPQLVFCDDEAAVFHPELNV